MCLLKGSGKFTAYLILLCFTRSIQTVTWDHPASHSRTLSLRLPSCAAPLHTGEAVPLSLLHHQSPEDQTLKGVLVAAADQESGGGKSCVSAYESAP